MSLFPAILVAFSLTADVGTVPPSTGSTHETIADVVDRRIDAGLGTLEASPQTTAHGLVRRLTLDLAGRIPTVVELQAYLQADHATRRERLVERLMASPEFSQYLAARLDWFITAGDGSVRRHLVTALEENHGWDQIFRDIVLADRANVPFALPYLKARVKDSERLANEVSVAFFGVNISCAKCHDHPLVPNWTQDHFYGMKSFFNRTFDNGGFVAEREYGWVNYQNVEGDERQAKLMFLTGRDVTADHDREIADEQRKEIAQLYRELKKKKQPPPRPKLSLREALVEVALRDGDDHFFARAIVNRIWHQFFGRGLVMPLDQMHPENPASHPELLQWLADDLVQHGYDLRRLIRGFVLSRAYSRSSEWGATGERPSSSRFAVASVRALTPIQLARSLALSTSDQRMLLSTCAEESSERIELLAKPRHIQVFDQPSDDFQMAANEALFFSNNPEFEQWYLTEGLVDQLAEMEEPRQMIQAAMRAILTRPAEPDEISLLGGYLAQRADRRRQAVQQIVWGLLASTEFRFNH